MPTLFPRPRGRTPHPIFTNRSAHFTNCVKPWECKYPHPRQPLCTRLTERWFEMRRRVRPDCRRGVCHCFIYIVVVVVVVVPITAAAAVVIAVADQVASVRCVSSRRPSSPFTSRGHFQRKEEVLNQSDDFGHHRLLTNPAFSPLHGRLPYVLSRGTTAKSGRSGVGGTSHGCLPKGFRVRLHYNDDAGRTEGRRASRRAIAYWLLVRDTFGSARRWGAVCVVVVLFDPFKTR